MAKTAKRRIGDTGEEVACKYLINKGFSVIERNYLKPWGEIDIIAQKGGGQTKKLYFIEVKTVTRKTISQGDPLGSKGSPWMRPEDNAHPAKLRRLHRAIQTYLLDRKVSGETPWQIDVACVYLDYDTHKARVQMLENVIL